MSNSTTSNPWVLDTGSATPVVAAGNKLIVEKMLWHPNATNDDLVVQDGNGNAKWTVRATAGAPNNESYGIERFDGPVEFDGFTLATIDDGTLYVYLHPDM